MFSGGETKNWKYPALYTTPGANILKTNKNPVIQIIIKKEISFTFVFHLFLLLLIKHNENINAKINKKEQI
jgi:glycerol-3-phosphate acyltransferase PlsY